MVRLDRAQGVATFWILLTYLAAFCVALAGALLLDGYHPLLIGAVACLGGTLMVFFFSLTFNNSSLYDPYWSVAPPVLGLYWLSLPEAGSGDPLRQSIVIGLVIFWGLRLSWNWYRSWKGIHHEDWRYVDLRKKNRKSYWSISFGGIHLFPSLLIYLGCLPLYFALVGDHAFGVLDVIGLVITFLGIAIETIADHQLWRFRKSNPKPDEILNTGLWALSRHPNYFGEITFWVGLFLISLGAAPQEWWVVIGPIGIILLFIFISIPLIDKRMISSRSGYKEHIKRVSALFPWPSKSSKQ